MVPRQCRGNPVPHHAGLRVPVEQEERWAAAARLEGNFDLADQQPAGLEHIGIDHPWALFTQGWVSRV